MCGIAGRYNYSSGAPVDAGVIAGMCGLLAHRGPDGQGVHLDGPLGLGHRRLSIIDLSEAGSQPMAYDGDRLWLAFNGEVYNFRSLRQELEGRGCRFASQTDSEVVLAAYRVFGLDFLERLRGMFALALWDAPARRLVLARDRVGKKPLTYRIDTDGIAFASEARALLADPAVVPRPNPAALLHYLAFQCVPAPLSAFDGVRTLPPAHFMVIEDGAVRVQRYWRLRYSPKRRASVEEAEDEVLERLRESVRLRLVSDVPLGAFLSGGIDSGIVVALMSEAGPRVKTFSIGFEEKEYNELPAARLVAERYATEHHEFVVRPEAASIVQKLVWHYSEPYADSSAIPTFYLSQLTRPHVTVALNGDGGDESFAGYERYLAQVVASRLDAVPRSLRRGAVGLKALIPGGGGPKTGRARAIRFLEALGEPPAERYARWRLQFGRSLKAQLCTPHFLAQSSGDSEALLAAAYATSDAENILDATLDVDVRTYLADDLLVKVDIAAMAHGLEARSPFLDQELMQLAASLPPGVKLRGRTPKFLLRRIARRLLPEDLVGRRKMGFAVPLDHWFRSDLREMARDLLLDRTARERGYFDPAFVERMLEEHASGARLWHQHLWTLLMFELWHRTFIDRRAFGRPA